MYFFTRFQKVKINNNCFLITKKNYLCFSTWTKSKLDFIYIINNILTKRWSKNYAVSAAILNNTFYCIIPNFTPSRDNGMLFLPWKKIPVFLMKCNSQLSGHHLETGGTYFLLSTHSDHCIEEEGGRYDLI